VCGRSILLGNEKLHVRGVTYGTFRSGDGSSFPSPDAVRRDLQAMVAAGVNCLRTYVPPPPWLLDTAHELGLKVMVGLAWEQHVAFLEDRARARAIVEETCRQVRSCEAHPAILCYALGNEIPASIVRWHGKRRVERFIEALYREGKSLDPDGLFTYVNYPSTEYLELPFLDLAAFNVFLEQEATFASYMARLQNVAGELPLLIAELGLDSRRNGERAQAQALGWQVRHAFAAGAAGTFVFSWTDEWHRGGHDVTDWEFGLVDRDREAKPALAAVSEAYASSPFGHAGPWPRVSVVVCTHNGERTLGECLAGVNALAYPDFETIVVCDGSTDRSAAIAREHGAVVVETDHLGLSNARNAGLARASGEIVAFLDDDAYPDADWLHHIAAGLRDPRYVGVGGPNIPPEDESPVAGCVAAAPGGPIHVLISDREAEHLPGCNMAFRRSALEAIGGFDERFRTAGDDVDVCWRLQKAGRTLGFSAGAVVMHRRRDSVRRYLRQQYGYGRAEALLERKWPGNYSRAGASRWSGRIYEPPTATALRRRRLVRYGVWGTGLFQSIYDPPPSALESFLRMPESLLALSLLALLAPLGLLWSPLLFALPAFAALLAWLAGNALACGWRAHAPVPGRSARETLERRAITALLFFLQPLARLAGRLRGGLSPWRRRLPPGAALPHPRTVEVWSEVWQAHGSRVQQLEDALAVRGGYVRSGGPFDRWDLALRAGPVGGVKIRVAVEEHGEGRQLLRARLWPAAPLGSLLTGLLLAALAALAWSQARPGLAVAIGVALLLFAALGLEGTATATRLAMAEIAQLESPKAAAATPAPPPALSPSLAPDVPLAGARRSLALTSHEELSR
jgi:O-antigen biosynthesis protein